MRAQLNQSGIAFISILLIGFIAGSVFIVGQKVAYFEQTKQNINSYTTCVKQRGKNILQKQPETCVANPNVLPNPVDSLKKL